MSLASSEKRPRRVSVKRPHGKNTSPGQFALFELKIDSFHFRLFQKLLRKCIDKLFEYWRTKMPHPKAELAARSAVKPERKSADELSISVDSHVPGMEAATRLATEIFTSLMFGMMVIPLELPMAMGFGAFGAINWSASRSGSARPR
jgi:hypothetical protein